MKAGLTLLCGLLMVTSVAAETLIKESEAKLPPAPVTAPATRASSGWRRPVPRD